VPLVQVLKVPSLVFHEKIIGSSGNICVAGELSFPLKNARLVGTSPYILILEIANLSPAKKRLKRLKRT
jgi:hypothetical protein